MAAVTARFVVDPARSKVWFEARSSLHPIRAETDEVEGFFEAELLSSTLVDASTPPTGAIVVPLAKLSSGNALYDLELRRRAGARRHPKITGRLSSLEETQVRGRYLVSGDVIFRDVTRSIQDVVRLQFLDPSTICLEGTHSFDMREFGIDPPRVLLFSVAPTVSVGMRLVASLAR